MVIDIRNPPPKLLAWFAKYIVCNRLIIFLHFHHWTYKSIVCTVYPKKYAHGFCFAVLCCGYTLADSPISIRITSLALWQSGNLTIAPVPAKQPWWIWINTSCEFIMNDCITTTKQSTTKPCAYFLGYTVYQVHDRHVALVSKPNTYLFILDRYASVWLCVRIELHWAHMTKTGGGGGGGGGGVNLNEVSRTHAPGINRISTF